MLGNLGGSVMKLKHKEKPKREKINPKEIMRSYNEKLHKELEEKGVNFFAPQEEKGSLNIDKDYLVLPSNITEVSTRDLGEYLNAFTQQKVYMRTLLGYAELYVEEARRRYIDVSDDKYRELLTSKLSETAKDREVNSDPKVRPVFEEYIDYKNKVKLLNLNIVNIEDIIFMLSREVSRRTGDFNEETRNYNVGRK